MVQSTQHDESGWVRRYFTAFIGVLLIVVIVVIAGFMEVIRPFWIWIILLALFVLMTLLLSRTFTRRWLGILIDDRNKYSLSRLQMILWTLIILSSFMASVLANVQLNLLVLVSGAVEEQKVLYVPSGWLVSDVLRLAGVLVYDEETRTDSAIPGVDLSQINLAEPLKDGQVIYVPREGEGLPLPDTLSTEDTDTVTPTTPLSVEIPSEVWILLGISTTSLVASPLIKGQKSEVIVKNQAASEAKLADLFSGEESGNFNLLDLAKVQLIYFTLIVIGTYMIAVANLFLNTQTAIGSLPALDGGVVALLGVSHAGYLSNKAVPRSSSASAEAAAASAPPTASPDDQTGVG